MSQDILDGVLGLEAKHTLYGVTLNDLSVDPRVTARAKLDHIAGLHDLPEKDDNRTPRTGRRGERAFSGQLRGKNVTYEGRVQAPTLQLLRRFVRQMRTAFAPEAETWVQIDPHPTYGGISWNYHARVTAFVCDDNQGTYGADAMPTRFQRPFTLTVRQSDPRYYVATLNDSGPHADGDMITVHNAGDIDSELVIYGEAPGGGTVSVTQGTAGIMAQLSLHDVPAGTVTIKTYDRSIFTGGSGAMGSGTLNGSVYDEAGSTWWLEDLPAMLPGDNTLQVRGLATWHAQWNDASI